MKLDPPTDDLPQIVQSMIEQPENVRFDPHVASRRATAYRKRQQQVKYRLTAIALTGTVFLLGALVWWPQSESSTGVDLPTATARRDSAPVNPSDSPALKNAQPSADPTVMPDQDQFAQELERLDQMRRDLAQLRRETRQLQQLRAQQQFWIVREELTRSDILTSTNTEL